MFCCDLPLSSVETSRAQRDDRLLHKRLGPGTDETMVGWHAGMGLGKGVVQQPPWHHVLRFRCGIRSSHAIFASGRSSDAIYLSLWIHFGAGSEILGLVQGPSR